jgi:hypothetical protein
MVNHAILVVNKQCGYCKEQMKIIKEFFKNKNAKVMMVDTAKNTHLRYATPSIIVFNESGILSVKEGLTKDERLLNLLNTKKRVRKTPDKRKISVKRKVRVQTKVKRKVRVQTKVKRKVRVQTKVKRKVRFGNKTSDYLEQTDTIPQTNVLEKYGKNFPNGNGFQTSNSFMQNYTSQFDDDNSALSAGALGISDQATLNKALSNDTYYDIRMIGPNEPKWAFMPLNRTCNISNHDPTEISYPGFAYDAVNPEIVDNNTGANAFGKKKKVKQIKPSTRRSRFGNLYYGMGPAYGSQYIVGQTTVDSLYGGGLQNENAMPKVVDDPLSWIGQAKPYNPVNLRYGEKNKKKKIKENDVPSSKSHRDKKEKDRTKIDSSKKEETKQSKKKLKPKKKKVKPVIGEGSVLTVKGNKIKVKNH